MKCYVDYVDGEMDIFLCKDVTGMGMNFAVM